MIIPKLFNFKWYWCKNILPSSNAFATIKKYGYKKGDFPVAEDTCNNVISLTVHEYITPDQIEFVVNKIKKFYA